MAVSVQSINLTTSSMTPKLKIFAKRNDAGSRFIRVSLFVTNSWRERVLIPASSEVFINAEKPDGTKTVSAGVVNEDGSVTVPVTGQTLASLGDVECDISIVSAEPSILTSASFTVEVVESQRDDELVESSDEFSLLTAELAFLAESKTSDIKGITYESVDARLEASETDVSTLQSDALISKIPSSAIINDLTTGGITNVLSAEQGKALSEQAATIQSNLSTAQTDISTLQSDTLISKTSISKNTSQINSIQSVVTNLNPNGEARVNIDTANQVVPLPINAAQGGVKSVMRGMTLTNLVENGDFSNGTDGWRAVNSARETIRAEQERLILSSYGQYSSVARTTKTINVANSNIFYISINYERLRSDVSLLKVRFDIETILTKSHLTDGKNFASAIYSSTSDFHGVSIQIDTLQDEISGGDLADVLAIDDITVIDLTAHGLTDLTLPQLDAMTADYIDGTQSVGGMMRLRSVGKNLFDFDDTYTSKYGAVLKVDYTKKQLSGVAIGDAMGWVFKDTLIEYTSGQAMSYSAVFASPNSVRPRLLIRLFDKYKANISDLSTADGWMLNAAYEALRPTNSNADSSSFITNDPNVLYIQLGLVFYDLVAGTRVTISDIQLEHGTATPYEPYTETIQYIQADTLKRAPTGEHDEISDGKLIKQIDENGDVLAEPIITENVTSGNLISHPKGAIYLEHALFDAGVYDSGITVLNAAYPIKTLETISTIDFVTGVETPIDVSTATISSDGLSFTHTDIANDDIVFFTYFYDYGGVYGENTYSYLDSNHVMIDTVTGKVYKEVKTVTNGELTSTLEEVF